jgi:DNA-binding NtrC family response regulator
MKRVSNDKALLLIEDDALQRQMIAEQLKHHIPHQLLIASTGRQAWQMIQQHSPYLDIVAAFIDVYMPGEDGLTLLSQFRERLPKTPVIMLTASDSVELAVKSMQMGASDFLVKPIDSNRLKACLHQIDTMYQLHIELERLKKQRQGTMGFSDIIGHNSGLIEAVLLGRKAAATDLLALITGETGVGKELFARAMHGESRRSNGPFIALNCGAIPPELVESTLFGHEKGAFTGADQKTIGVFREAENGTLFLDEIGELPLAAQVKLLRVLQTQEIEPVGLSRTYKVNVRIIAATNRDLAMEVSFGRMRQDLYYRLHVLCIDVPPLRKRKEDIPLLVDYFLQQGHIHHHLRAKKLAKTALSKLLDYDWPGNVRELEHSIMRAMVEAEGELIHEENIHIHSTHIVEGSNNDALLSTLIGGRELWTIGLLDANGKGRKWDDIEQEILLTMLRFYKGNMQQTARELGIAKSTLYRKLDR